MTPPRDSIDIYHHAFLTLVQRKKWLTIGLREQEQGVVRKERPLYICFVCERIKRRNIDFGAKDFCVFTNSPRERNYVCVCDLCESESIKLRIIKTPQ